MYLVIGTARTVAITIPIVMVPQTQAKAGEKVSSKKLQAKVTCTVCTDIRLEYRLVTAVPLSRHSAGGVRSQSSASRRSQEASNRRRSKHETRTNDVRGTEGVTFHVVSNNAIANSNPFIIHHPPPHNFLSMALDR
jgi:hypothetical protein